MQADVKFSVKGRFFSPLCCFLVALGVSQNISDEILIGGGERRDLACIHWT